MQQQQIVTTMGQHQAARYVDEKDIFVAMALSKFSQPKTRFLEVGVLFGGWVIHFLLNVPGAKSLGIDPYPGEEGVRIRTKMSETMRIFGLSSRFGLIESWKEISGKIEGDSFDIIHIDGDHSENAVLSDLKNAQGLLAEGGYIIVDDWHHPMFPGVGSALHRFMAQSDYRMFAVTDRKAFLCHKNHHQKSQAFLADHLNSSEAVEWCWQHGKLPSGRKFRAEPTKEALGHVAGYTIENTVLGLPVMLILGAHNISTQSTPLISNPEPIE